MGRKIKRPIRAAAIAKTKTAAAERSRAAWVASKSSFNSSFKRLQIVSRAVLKSSAEITKAIKRRIIIHSRKEIFNKNEARITMKVKKKWIFKWRSRRPSLIPLAA